MTHASRLLAAALATLCALGGAGGCSVTRPDQDNLILDTSRVPVERFLDALSKRLDSSWSAFDENLPDHDPSKMYTLEARRVSVTLSAMPHDRCNPNAPYHTTWDKAYRIDFVYRTSDPAERQDAKRKLIQAASDVGERLSVFEECRY